MNNSAQSLESHSALASFTSGFFTLLFLCLCLFPSNAFPSTTSISSVLIEKQGKVEFSRKGSTDWASAQTNEVLQAGDRLRTGLRARATLRWSENAVVRVDELTSMEIQPPSKPGAKAEMELKSGATYFFSREKPEDIQFRTPVASGAIRGTEFNLRVAEDGTTELALLHGEVALANAQGEATLKSGELGTVSKGSAPAKSPLLNAAGVIQWVMSYPAVVDVDEIGLSDASKRGLADCLATYRSGDLQSALEQFPESRAADSDSEKLLQASLLLAAGQAGQAAEAIKSLPASAPANALREIISTVKGESLSALGTPTTASEWMARSYQLQSRKDLNGARDAAHRATQQSPQFGAAWVRLGELEFSFGSTDKARQALEKGLALSPRNANGLALQGFILAAQNRNADAMASFEKAIATDGSLANAWLGRGLLKIRGSGNVLKFTSARYRAGLDDLQVAATLDPQRAVLRSYLGKAFSEAHDLPRARKELGLARELDANDPTSWLYSALLNQSDNRSNEAVEDLEKSKELNNNRSVFRSQLLLDQDEAVRGANLAAMYRDVGMFDRSVQEASRAVGSDYANYSAHLFLANSYDSLRDPNLINLRYETAWFSELLVANLLAPPGGGTLSQNISQQEYSRFFVTDGMGLFSQTEYGSGGDWIQNASVYGLMGKTGYSLDTTYRNENGDRPNNDLEQFNLALRLKHQITERDSVFLQVGYFDLKSGDIAQYYDQSQASTTARAHEEQNPNLLAGFHRAWTPAHHTLLMFARFDDTLHLTDSDPTLLYRRTAVSPFTGNTNVSLTSPAFFSRDFESDLTAYSAELQHIWQADRLSVILGGRFQTGSVDTRDDLNRTPPAGIPTQVLSDFDTDISRYSAYSYLNYDLLDSLQLIGGLSFDRLEYPVNSDTSPVSDEETDKDQLSPKAGFIWSPLKETHVRGLYSQSLGGVFFDNSIRLEPATLAGFNQAYRSMIPESVAGLVPGTEFESWGLGFDHAFETRTYFFAQAEVLESDGTRTVGLLENSDTLVPVADTASSTRQSLDFREQSVTLALNQLIGTEYAVGARYKFTHAELDTQSLDIAPTVSGAGALNQDVESRLHQVWLYGIYQHRCGFFSQVDAVWSGQSNSGYSPGLDDEDVWQFNAYVGYRFLQRRGEVRVGLLNIGDEDYKLNPLTLYNELPRERTLTVMLKLNF
jgi:Tfp pilus assembly protein PilF